MTVRASTRRGRCEDGESPGGPKSQDAADWRIFGEPRQYCDLALAFLFSGVAARHIYPRARRVALVSVGSAVVCPRDGPSVAAMDEILALQAALQSAQDQKSSIRLSERNVVELVNKLKDLDLLDKSLLYTLNGKEYVTQSRLDAEIKREVRRSGGRVPVVDLQPALNVDVAHCERQARALAEDPANQFSLVEGELMTPSYFDAVAAEVDEELRESGVVAVGNLARRHGLSADLMSKALEERVGRVVEGRMEGGLLYTPGYVARLTAQLRGAMRAALVPTTRDALASNILSEGDDRAGAELTGAVVGDLARRDDVADGAFRGGAWNPAVYVRAQTAAVAEAYRRDGLMTKEQARRMGVDAPEKYFRELDPDVARLDASFVSRAALEQLDAAAAEALANEGWCEAEMLMPPDLPAGDAPALFAVPGDSRRRENKARDDGREVRRENARRGSVGRKSGGGDERVSGRRARARENTRRGGWARGGDAADRSRGWAFPREGALDDGAAAALRARRKRRVVGNLAAARRTRTKTPRTPSPSPRKISKIRTTTRAGPVARRVRRADAAEKAVRTAVRTPPPPTTPATLATNTPRRAPRGGGHRRVRRFARAGRVGRVRDGVGARGYDRRRLKRSRRASRPRRALPTRDEKTRASPPPPRSRRHTHSRDSSRAARRRSRVMYRRRDIARTRARFRSPTFFFERTPTPTSTRSRT